MVIKGSPGGGAKFRGVLAKARAAALQVVYRRTILLLTVMFGVGVAATLWHLSRLSSKLVESGALTGTAIYSESISDLRTFYNSEVVDRVRPHGVVVTHDYASKDGAIPIPATFTIEFGKHISEKNSGMQLRLYSDYPFPFRKEGGPKDNFEREALAQLRKQPDKPFFRFEDFQGRPSLRYGVAVQMKAGCVDCHNSHPESPKTDWKVGDVRGVQEIIRPLDSVIAETHKGLQDTFMLLSTMGLLGLGGLALVIGRMRRTSSELEQRVAERTAAEARLGALHAINLAATSTLDLRAMLDLLLEKSDHLLPFIAATTVRLVNKQTGGLEPVACRNLDEDEWRAETTKTPSGLPNMMPQGNEPVMVLNAQTDPRSLASGFLRKYGLVSLLRVPLIAKGETLGVITFFTKKQHVFTGEEVEFLTALAGQAAIAIQNAQLYEETIASKGELERANSVKDEFLGTMSHELRTPLNVIMGYTTMIKEGTFGEINPDQDKALDKVISRAKDQLTMISSILQATQVEAGGIRIRNHEVRLGEFLDDLRSGYEIPLEKGIRLHWDYPANLPTISTDGEKLKHVLQNLINNALKFTERGMIAISARVEEPPAPAPSASDPGWLEFKVADTGIGISQADLPAIFDKFRQVDSSETRPYGGVGIGLYIVKTFVDLLGGEISVESERGRGSTFTVRIPCEGPKRIATDSNGEGLIFI